MKSMFVWPSRTVAKSMSGEPRRRTSARPLCHLPSMMPSSMCDAGCRIMFRRLQGQVKQHEGQPMGTVKSLDASGEFGFLEAADGHEVYFHRNSVLDGAYNRLAVGTHVAFAEEMGEKGPQASTVKLLGKHRLRV